ncbi:hypothetical protein CEY09_31670 [Achromobacter marplatensis]|uniref:Phage protein n=1 Tax=Achromobacter marplatensis TaxID=470868 RepID=A0ABX9FSS5_9BURK|nr:hypothetical protein [Achromobacter marplatensis]OWT53801.1 hypothetical protein CEY09_31670 [Achromobacter marplatensis]RBP09283.1 hypothetical protein DFP87_1356 [Achromobacter marplatensis]CAB3717268.1 hypothetical protein LMG26219_06317 [Achromobacter marplatensis]
MSTIKLPELPAPFEPEWPDLNPHALGCGVEDRGIVSRYEAAEYGFQDGVNKAAQCVPEDIYTGEQMRAYAEEAVRQALAALGKAISAQANIQRFNYQTHGCNPYFEGMADGLDVAEQKVLAAIPETGDG